MTHFVTMRFVKPGEKLEKIAGDKVSLQSPRQYS